MGFFYDKYKEFLKVIPKNTNILIYGVADAAVELLKNIKLKRKDITVRFFINSLPMSDIGGIEVLTPDKILNHIQENDYVIISSFSSGEILKNKLLQNGINNIVVIPEDLLVKQKIQLSKNDKILYKKSLNTFCDKKSRELYKNLFEARLKNDNRKIRQYYNKNILNNNIEEYLKYIKTDCIEVAIDGGAYTGDTAVMFLNNFKNIKKIYSFEALYDKFKIDDNDLIIKKSNKVEIIDKLLWDENKILSFQENTHCAAGSKVVEFQNTNNIQLEATTIDNFVNEKNINKIDFIKLDIEDAEMPALKGALNTIRLHRPQLAICIYHSFEQFLNIPNYLNSNFPNYKFYLEQYLDYPRDTVLYAIPNEI